MSGQEVKLRIQHDEFDFVLDVNTDELISDLKDRIERRVGIPSSGQKLVLTRSGVTLRNKSPIHSYGLGTGDDLRLYGAEDVVKFGPLIRERAGLFTCCRPEEERVFYLFRNAKHKIHCLCYSDETKVHRIHLADVKDVINEEDSGSRFPFTVVAKTKSYKLWAGHQSEKLEWLDLLAQEINTFRNPGTGPSVTRQPSLLNHRTVRLRVGSQNSVRPSQRKLKTAVSSSSTHEPASSTERFDESD